MPNDRDQYGCPKWIYRIDSRSPDEIFESGFQTWGTNTNFFQHILGRSLGDDIPENERSGIISGSDSPDSSLRFFGGMLDVPGERLEYYLYEIRADENVYSALRTASFYEQRINTGLVDFDEGDLDTMIDAVDSVVGIFAYQREWFNVGSISRERVRSAWRVDSVQINPAHIRHQRRVHYTPRINEPEILNSHFVDHNTFANHLPYTEGATLESRSRVSIPSELVEADASGGVGASLGFACSPHSSPKKDKRSPRKNLVCYFDKGEVKVNLKNPKSKPYIFSDVYRFKFYLRGARYKNKDFLLSYKTTSKGNEAAIVEINSWAPDFIYDMYNCISWTDPKTNLAFALTPINVGSVIDYELSYSVATINDTSQKWVFDIVESNDIRVIARIRSMMLKDFSIQRNLYTNKLFLRPIKEAKGDFDELYVVISDNRCDDCVLLPQRTDSKLVDIGLSWFYENTNYVFIPESNTSKQGHMLKNTFFYDLNTYKIAYMDKNLKVWALKNNRQGYNWNWAVWMPCDLNKTSNKKFKWYFDSGNFFTYNEINCRNIRSFENNDLLWVTTNGVNWGSLYTTNSPQEIRSSALFRINKEADI